MRWPPPADWPMSNVSQLILHRPHRWHVQIDGEGPEILLLHGAGGATQSWRHLFPRLAVGHRVIAVDLPGQGFSQSGAQRRFGLDAMAEDLLSLSRHLEWSPDLIVGHSAGCALALRMVELGARPTRIIGLNAALGNFKGVAGWLFPVLAKALATTPIAAQVFAATATAASVRKLIEGTGSTLDPEGEALYLALCRDSAHVDATLSMMAQWSLDGLLSRIHRIDTPIHFITGARDQAVPPSVSRDVAARMPRASVTSLPSLGHLAHEEDAGPIADLIRAT